MSFRTTWSFRAELAVIPSGGAKRRSRGIAVLPVEGPPDGTLRRLRSSGQALAIPRLRASGTALGMTSITDGVSGDFQEYVLEGRQNRAKVGDADALLGEAANHFRHEVLARAVDRQATVVRRHRRHLRHPAKAVRGRRVLRREHHRALWTVAPHEPLRRVHVDDAAVVDDR